MSRTLLCLAVSIARGASGPVAFDDVTAASGIDFVLDNAAGSERRLIETMVGGVAVLDFNNDGRPDLFFANGAEQPSLRKTHARHHNRLYRNEGGWRFRDVTAELGVAGEGYSIGVAAADFDNDGFLDIFVAGVDRDILYRNRDGRRFEDVTARAGVGHTGPGRKPWAVGAAWFDYDADGWLDLFIVHYVAWDPALERPCASGKSRIYCHPKHYAPLPNRLLRNNRDGTFTDVSRESGIGAHAGKGMAAAVLDYDADGRLDVFVTNDTVPNFLFRNEGGGKFRETALTAGVAFSDDGRALSSMGADARDIDNDGLEDLFVTANHNETFPLFRNLGRGLFTDIAYPSAVGRHTMASTGWGNGVFDFDNDGRKDLFAARGAIDANLDEFSHRKARQPNQVLVNRGGARFDDVSVAGLDQAGLHRGAAFGDFDGDGRVDAVVTRIGERAVLLRNVSPAAQWLGLRLRGHKSNRDGLGAWVHVTAASGSEQWNRATTAVGYASASDRAVLFGMGADAVARSVEIRWPSGARQTLRDEACGRYLVVDEP